MDALAEGAEEWQNIQDAVREAIRELVFAVRHQEKQQAELAAELRDQRGMGRSRQPPIEVDHLRETQLEQERTITELQAQLRRRDAEMDELRDMVQNQSSRSWVRELVDGAEQRLRRELMALLPSAEDSQDLSTLRAGVQRTRDRLNTWESSVVQLSRQLEDARDVSRQTREELNTLGRVFREGSEMTSGGVQRVGAEVQRLRAELQTMEQSLSEKANAAEMHEAIHARASKASVTAALHRKANKEDVAAQVQALESKLEESQRRDDRLDHALESSLNTLEHTLQVQIDEWAEASRSLDGRAAALEAAVTQRATRSELQQQTERLAPLVELRSLQETTVSHADLRRAVQQAQDACLDAVADVKRTLAQQQQDRVLGQERRASLSSAVVADPLGMGREGTRVIRRAEEAARKADDTARNAHATSEAVSRRMQAVESRLDQLAGWPASSRDRRHAAADMPQPSGSALSQGLLERVEGLEAEVHRVGLDLRAVREESRSTASLQEGTQAAVETLERKYIRLANQVERLQQLSTSDPVPSGAGGMGRTSPLLSGGSEVANRPREHPGSPPRLGATLATLQQSRWRSDKTHHRHEARRHVASPPTVDASARGPLGAGEGRRV